MPRAFAQSDATREVGNPDALLAQLRLFLAAVTASQTLVLVLEDLHWADRESVELLRALARDLGSVPALVIATYRADEITVAHPLGELMPAMVREARATRIGLPPLQERDVDVLVRRQFMLPARDRQRLVRYLQARGEGNPFFIGELLHALEEKEVLRGQGNGWVLGDLSDIGIPPLVRQVIRGRLDALGANAQRLLAVGALIGQEVPLALWASITEETEESLFATVERALAFHLLAETSDTTRFRFVHALIREALVEDVPVSQRRLSHRRIGEALTGRVAPDPDDVAYHFRQAGDHRAVEWLLRAGDRAERAYAWWTASERFEAALAILDASDASAAERAWLRIRIWDLNRYSDPGRGIHHLEAAGQLAAEANDPALAACLLRERGKLHIFLGEQRQGLIEVEAGHHALDALPATTLVDPWVARRQRRGRAALATWLAEVGRYADATVFANRVLSTTEDGDAYFALGIIHAGLGRPEEAHIAFDRARELLSGVASPYRRGTVAAERLSNVILPYQADLLLERQAMAREAETIWGHVSMMLAAGSARLAQLPLLVLEGMWDEVDELANQVLEDHRAIRAWRRFLIRDIASVAYARGDAALIRQLINEWLSAGPATEPGDAHYVIAIALQQLAAELAIDAIDLPTAHAWLEAHDRWLTWSGATLGRAEGALGWARYHRAAGDCVAAHRHASSALGYANAPRQPLALLAAHRLLGELNVAAKQYTDAATHLAAALNLADTCAAPYERALTLLAQAELSAAVGDEAEALTLLDEVRGICGILGAAPARARADALAARLAGGLPSPFSSSGSLTHREVEVLRLLAGGSTIRQIAAELFLSARTVERHITTIYRKIGARGRVDATAYAVQHGLTAAARHHS